MGCMDHMGRTTITVRDETRQALLQLGSMNDSYDDVVCRLVEAEHGDGAVEQLANESENSA